MMKLFLYDAEIENEEYELEETLDEFFNLSDHEDSFLGLIDQNDSIVQFIWISEDKWLVDYPQNEQTCKQIYADYDECVELINKYYREKKIVPVKNAVEVSIFKETIDEVLQKKSNISEEKTTQTIPYKTLNGKDYTKEEWEKYEQEQWEKYKNKK